MMEFILLSMLLIPLISMLLQGLSFFFRISFSEFFLSDSVKWLSLLMSGLGGILLFLVIQNHFQASEFNYSSWLKIGDYEFKLRFLVDVQGTIYGLLTALLIGIIFRFSRSYLHKEPGYFRFIFLLTTLMFGLMLVSFCRSLDMLFAGWELVGTASVLLIGYFYTQPQPVRHSLKALISYRFCDMGILAAAAWAHHYLHETDFTLLPSLITDSNHHTSQVINTFIGLFIVWAALAKSGQLPFCSWLPAAMEGPTPSSAIFYGALSIHLGPFLLLRFYDYFIQLPLCLWVIGIVGALTALYASAVGRTRPDAKTMLAYATISQVGLIWVEIALGFTRFALFHLFAHASLRTWQYLRSSSLIQDFFENPMVLQEQTIKRGLSFELMFSKDFRRKFFIHALHGFHLDFLTQQILLKLSMPFRWYFAWEKSWMNLNNKMIKFFFNKRDL